MFADLHRQLFPELDHFVRKIFHDKIALFHLEIGQALLHPAFRRRGRVDVAAIEIKCERLRVSGAQRIAPTLRNHERGLDAVSKKIGLVRYLGRRLSPAKSLVLHKDIDETLRPRVVVAINQHCRHVADLARFKGVTEEQSEKRRQNE